MQLMYERNYDIDNKDSIGGTNAHGFLIQDATGTNGFNWVIKRFGMLIRPGGGAYSTVKAGQIGLMQTMAAEYGPKGVRSNYIASTVVKTGMTADFWDLDFFRRTNHELTPLQRECSVDDVANMVAFLASDSAGMVNGQTIAVDGGVSTTRYLAPAAISR